MDHFKSGATKLRLRTRFDMKLWEFRFWISRLVKQSQRERAARAEEGKVA